MSTVYVLYCEAPHGYFVGAAQCPENEQKEIAVELEFLTGKNPHFENLDSTMVAQTFSVGFSVVVLFFLVGVAVGSVLKLIKEG